MKICVTSTHRSKRELVSHIAGVESLRIVPETVQVKMIWNLIRDLSYIVDLWKDDGSRGCMEACRKWNDFDKAYLLDNKYTSVLIAIMGK